MDTIKTKNKELVKGTIIYAIGSFGSKVLSLLIVPLYTFYIIPEELGNYDLIITTINLLIPIITFQITDAAYKKIAEKFEERKKIISCTYWILLISSIVSSILCVLIGKFTIGIKYAIYLTVMLIVQMWFMSLQRLLRALKRQKTFVIAGIFQTFCFLIFILILVCWIKLKVDGLCISYIVAHLFAIIYMIIQCKELIVKKVKYNKSNLLEMLRFSIPLIPNSMSWWLINSSDKYIIRLLLGASSNGIYSVSSKFPAVLQTVNGLFYSSWQDVAIREKPGKERDRFYTNTFEKYYELIFGLVLIAMPATRVLLPLIVSTEYKSAALYSTFIYLGMVFQGFSSFYGINYLNHNKTFGATSTSIVAAIVNLIVDLILMPYIGLYAAGISTFMGFLIMWLIRVKQTKKITNIQINKRKFLAYLSISIICAIISIFANRIICTILTIIFIIIFIIREKYLIGKIINNIFNKKI